MLAISVVVPLFNKASHIARCLHSVRGQTLQPAEIIVVDDGSTDESAALAERELRPGDKLIRQTNQGAAAARLTGIKTARHDFIAFVDADDEWLADHLATLATAASTHDSADAFGTGYVVVTTLHGLGMEVRFSKDRLLEKNEYFRWARPYPLLNSSNTMVRRSFVASMGNYPTSLRRQEDLLFTSMLASKSKIAVQHSVTAVIHLDAQNRAAQVRRHVHQEPWFEGEMLNNYCSSHLPDEERQWLKGYMKSQLLHGAYNLIVAGELAHARMWLRSRSVKELGVTPQALCLLAFSNVPPSLVKAVRVLRAGRLLLPRVSTNGVSTRWKRCLTT